MTPDLPTDPLVNGRRDPIGVVDDACEPVWASGTVLTSMPELRFRGSVRPSRAVSRWRLRASDEGDRISPMGSVGDR
ncbi:hypothetical protein [Amycolatopsis sp. NPDC051903]|uniref:hypothetical protein n=1 Tax=Amycolatopsis sp. NPDC051903 TaxID=3363936 RepID=UPI0037BCDB39